MTRCNLIHVHCEARSDMAIPRRIPRALGNRHTGLRGGCCIEGGMDYEGQQ